MSKKTIADVFPDPKITEARNAYLMRIKASLDANSSINAVKSDSER